MLIMSTDITNPKNAAGIGTYVVSGSLTHTSARARISSWYNKAKDSAIGSSFDQHVVGGYRFLMRFYNPGDEIYMFGFSRGAYIARFLAEMLDYIGLLSHGNEEMVKFAWKAFSQWQCRQQSIGSDEEVAAADAEKRRMYTFMKGFRETFSRPVGRIRFLGLFDTVNSVPRFETAWMQRSKFPYTARSSAKVIRHAVSIDERRAKFRQDLMYQGNPKVRIHHMRHVSDWLGKEYWNFHSSSAAGKARIKESEKEDVAPDEPAPSIQAEGKEKDQEKEKNQAPVPASDGKAKASLDRGRRLSQYLSTQQQNQNQNQPENLQTQRRGAEAEFTPYRARSASRRRPQSQQRKSQAGAGGSRPPSSARGDGASDLSNISPSEVDPDWDEDGQDIDEVWFAGGHADVGGGWEMLEDSKSASHVPLAWVVREAMRAGLPFDTERVAQMGCACSADWDGINPAKRKKTQEELAQKQSRKQQKQKQKQKNKEKRQTKKQSRTVPVPDIRMDNGAEPAYPESPSVTQPSQTKAPDLDTSNDPYLHEAASAVSSDSSSSSDSDSDSDDEHERNFHGVMNKAHTARIHDSLAFGGGLGPFAVAAWKFMEYLPFRRMDLKGDGSWEPIRWPLPRGEVRDVPNNVRVHGSVIRRMEEDSSYRPGNLIIGGGGRGVKKAPREYGIGDWVCVSDPGDPIGETWMRREKPAASQEENGEGKNGSK